jgi:NAD(P)-dependent dehydrogenase (short-subunit alcohol dehydrogenase family)
MSLFSMAGQVALITGSSRGIGKAIAEEMAVQGAKVIISSRKQAACDDVAAELNVRHGAGTAIAVAANISSKESLQQVVDAAVQAFGKVTALVCNAASNPYYGPMAGISDDQFRKILDNNIVSNHWLIQMVAPEMLARGEGSITIISSIAGIRANSVIGAYGISKAADMALARNLADEYGPRGVRVNCIAPGLIKTDFARALWENPTTLTRATAGASLKRIGEPHEIAGAAVFLASKAGGFTTGQTIVIDGGVTTGGGAG